MKLGKFKPSDNIEDQRKVLDYHEEHAFANTKTDAEEPKVQVSNKGRKSDQLKRK